MKDHISLFEIMYANGIMCIQICGKNNQNILTEILNIQSNYEISTQKSIIGKQNYKLYKNDIFNSKKNMNYKFIDKNYIFENSQRDLIKIYSKLQNIQK